jgi:membrane-bound lytic murein transglycosylase B
MKLIIFLLSLINFNYCLAVSNDSPNLDYNKPKTISWEAWLKNLKKDLEKERFKKSTIQTLDNLTFNSKVIEYDRKQPEFKLNFSEYLKRNINSKKKKELKENYSKYNKLLNKISLEFDVDSKVLTSLWGIETAFGKHLGKMDIIRSLASLAYDGRRKKFFLKELRFALKILDDGHINKKHFKGSWAGAFGQTQFMPSTFHKYAIDFDKNDKINLFDRSDALASGANYLKNAGWNNKLLWGEKININLTDNLKKMSKNKKFQKQKFWKNHGVFLKNQYNKDVLFRLIIPDLEENHFFLVTRNFDVILDWNRSNYFALTVFLLSNEIQD